MIKHSALLKINTKNIINNYNFFRKLKKKLIVAPTIKANAYGLGDQRIYELFLNHGCKHFFVATLDEALNIKRNKKGTNIYVLNGIEDYDLKYFINNKIIPIVNSIEELNIIKSTKIKFGLHIDTGINRLGIDYKNLPDSILKNNNILLILSHLSSADEKNNNYNDVQRIRFSNIIRKTKRDIIFSLSNSNGSILNNTFLHDMVRPGIGLYGGNNKSRLQKFIKPVIELKGKIIQIKKLEKNQFVGYNQTHKTKSTKFIAIIGMGYADGIPRNLSNKGYVYFKNFKLKIIGRISMDSFTIDITKQRNILKTGMFVEIINYKYGIEEFANKCGTISNEVLTSIGSRVKRIYE